MEINRALESYASSYSMTVTPLNHIHIHVFVFKKYMNLPFYLIYL